MRRALHLVALFAWACARHEPAPPPSSSAAPADAAVGGGDPPLAPTTPAAMGAAALLRLERWGEAARALDALPEAERETPVVRLARARAALGAGDAKAAITALEGLEVKLPDLADRIARARASAWLEVGPWEKAGDWFAAQTSPADWLRAARAYERSGDDTKMRAQCARVIEAHTKSRSDEAAARALRLSKERGGEAAADAAWLETEAPDLPESRAATSVPDRRALRGDEQLARARHLADAGHVADARAALDEGSRAQVGAIGGAALDRARADVEWRARSWTGAATAYAKLAAAGGPRAAEDAFLAARALSRADRDDDAIAAYRALARTHPRSRWATQATFQIARLDLLHARFADAVRGLEQALASRDLGADRGEAQRLLPIARLLAGDAAKARRELEDRVRREGGAGIARELAALAALRAGDKAAATSAWRELAEKAPLTWPGLLARARLVASGSAPPTLAPPPVTSALLPPTLPPLASALATMGLEDDAIAVVARREAELRRAWPGRETEALCAAYGAVGAGRRRFQLAQAIAPGTLEGLPDARRAWAWSCAYPTPFAGPVRDAETREKLPPGLIHAVMRQESAFDPRAVSPARAVGLLQLLPETARTVAGELGVPHADTDLVKPAHNVALGAHFLASLLDKQHGRTPLAVAAYNAGPEALDRWRSRLAAADVDVFVELIPFAETRRYVALVMTSLARYAYLSGGEAALPKIELLLE
jgi:soluble lytic murein transglycosylase